MLVIKYALIEHRANLHETFIYSVYDTHKEAYEMVVYQCKDMDFDESDISKLGGLDNNAECYVIGDSGTNYIIQEI